MSLNPRQSSAFIPWRPVAAGKLKDRNSKLAQLARGHNATPTQIQLAWILHRSPVMLPILGTNALSHLEENVGAPKLKLTDQDVKAIEAAV